MPGHISVVDIDVTLDAEGFDDVDFINTDLHVVDAEIERVFGGGGSKARVDVIFEDFLSQNQEDLFQRLLEAETIDDLPQSIRDDISLDTISIDPEDIDRISSPDEIGPLSVVDNEEITFKDIVPRQTPPFNGPQDRAERVYNRAWGGKNPIPNTFDPIRKIFPPTPQKRPDLTFPETVSDLNNAPLAKKIAISQYFHKGVKGIEADRSKALN